MAWNARHVFSVGEVATSANVNNNFANSDYIPHEWDYAQITASVGIPGSGTEGTATSVIAGNSVTYDGTRVKIEAWLPYQYNASGAGDTSSDVFGVLLRDATVLGQFRISDQDSTNTGTPVRNQGGTALGVFFDTPSAASHTYTVKAFAPSSWGTAGFQITAGAGGSGKQLPAWLRVTAAKSNP